LEDFYLGKDSDTPISEVAFEWEPWAVGKEKF
jgi:hypothetical protein